MSRWQMLVGVVLIGQSLLGLWIYRTLRPPKHWTCPHCRVVMPSRGKDDHLWADGYHFANEERYDQPPS